MNSATDKWLVVGVAVLMLGILEFFLLRGIDSLDRRFSISDRHGLRLLKLALVIGGCVGVVAAAMFLPRVFSP